MISRTWCIAVSHNEIIKQFEDFTLKKPNIFLFVYSLPLTGFNIRQYCKNSLLSSCNIPVIYLLSNIPNFSVINLISYVGINSVFINANT